MQATPPDVLALKNSGLDDFLYADIGAEQNGLPLTVLSMLARLGRDPWAEAAGWAGLPKATAIDDLSQIIAQIPLAPAARAVSHDTAARLVQLLPGRTRHVVPAGSGGTTAALAMPNWSLLMTIGCGIVVWMVLNLALTFKPPMDGTGLSTPLVAVPATGTTAAVPPMNHAAGAPAPSALQ